MRRFFYDSGILAVKALSHEGISFVPASSRIRAIRFNGLALIKIFKRWSYINLINREASENGKKELQPFY